MLLTVLFHANTFVLIFTLFYSLYSKILILMGVFNSVLLGKVRGSVGNVTMQNWKGLNTVRTKPTDVANPNTEAQQEQRGKFALLVQASRVLASVFAIGLAKQAIKKTAYNVFVQLNNAAELVYLVGSDFEMDLSKLILSKGSATPISSAIADIDGGNVIVDIDSFAGSVPPADSTLYAAIIRDNKDGTCSLIGFNSVANPTTVLTVICNTAPSDLTDRALIFYVDANTLQPCDSFNVAVTA